MLGPDELLVPVGSGTARRVQRVVCSEQAGRWTEIGFKAQEAVIDLPGIGGAANLLATGPKRLVAASSRTLAVYEWRLPEPPK
jgi:hypothetical protein